jgi:uncharacterized membrane protein (UPF0127 family)
MEKARIGFVYNNKKIEVNVKVCNFLERFLGLMFINQERAKALLFDFKKPSKIGIHSYFVFFRFVAVWLDNEDNVVDLKFVKPFTFLIRPRKYFSKLVEIPINRNYDKVVKLFY